MKKFQTSNLIITPWELGLGFCLALLDRLYFFFCIILSMFLKHQHVLGCSPLWSTPSQNNNVMKWKGRNSFECRHVMTSMFLGYVKVLSQSILGTIMIPNTQDYISCSIFSDTLYFSDTLTFNSCQSNCTGLIDLHYHVLYQKITTPKVNNL